VGGHNFLAVQLQQQRGGVVGSNFYSIIRGEMQILPGGQFRVVHHHASAATFTRIAAVATTESPAKAIFR